MDGRRTVEGGVRRTLDPLRPARQHVVEHGVVVHAVGDGDPGLRLREVRRRGVLEDVLHGELALGGSGLVVGPEADGDDAVGGLGQEGEEEREETRGGPAGTHDDCP